jgi:HAD superfamily hydrolase (TIGR01490 family)
MQPMEAAFFDLDKTVISRSSSFALSRPMRRAGFVSRGQMLRAAYAQLLFVLLGADEKRMDKAKNALLELTRGWERAEVEELVREVVIEVIDPYVYQEALDLMAEHREAGRRVFIVSSAPEEVVYPIARHFGADGVVATRAEIVDGLYTGKLAFYCYGQAKSDAVRSLARRLRVDLSASYAYSDSVTDLPMLEAVGHPVVVNGSRELRKEAETRGWDVRSFERPVPLIPRPPVPPPKPTIAVVALAVMAAVAAWLFIRTRRGGRRFG